MQFIPLSYVKIAPGRQRKDFDIQALADLRESIQTQGLFHPIVLRAEGADMYLVAGERRLRAISDLYDLGGTLRLGSSQVPEGMIPYTNLGDLDELSREEAELDENIRRTDLSWQERAEATSRLAALRAKQAVVASAPAPTLEEVAEEVYGAGVGRAREVTRREMIVAKHLDNPIVAKAKSVDEAYKVLKKEELLRKHRDLGLSLGTTFSSEDHTLLNKDSLAWMQECPDEMFDVILTDPPYGMSAEEFGDAAGKVGGDHSYEDSTEVFERCLGTLIKEASRITKPKAHLYIFCDPDRFAWIRTSLLAAGWEVHRTPMIWDKVHGSRVPWPEYGPRRNYEFILYAVKGKRPTTCVAPDILSFPTDPNLGHAAQKPVALYTELLRRSCFPGDSVLDPFGGSGPIVPAAHSLKVRATYIEQDPAFYSQAISRISTLKARE